MATFDVAKLLNKITQDIPGINTVLKALANWDVSALSDVPDGAMQATTDANNNLTIKKKVSGSYTPVAKLMHDVDKLDGYHASASATANAVAVRNAQGALPGNILGNAATADTATALATGTVVPVNQGGTGATTASQALANLGVAGGADFTTHIAKQASPSVEGHVKLDALAADGSNKAAPGGYGLGTGAVSTSDWDTVVKSGWYASAPGANGAPLSNAITRGILINGNNDGNCYQFVLAGDSDSSRIFTRKISQNTPSIVWRELPNGITDSTSTTSSTIAASAAAVKAVKDTASGAQTDASTALARTAPATTTARGIGRIATLADMEPGAVIENGPAFLAAEVNTAVSSAAGKIPVADDDGTLDGWVSDATSAVAGKTKVTSTVSRTGTDASTQKGAYDTATSVTTSLLGAAFRQIQGGNSGPGGMVGNGAIGSSLSIAASGDTKLPAGGTWWVFLLGFEPSGCVDLASVRVYCVPGGTSIGTRSTYYSGFAIRIA